MSDILHFLIKLCIDHVVFGVVYFIYADITVVVQKWEFGGKMCLIGIKMKIQKDEMVLKLGFFFSYVPFTNLSNYWIYSKDKQDLYL